jgi:hypothetical protein
MLNKDDISAVDQAIETFFKSGNISDLNKLDCFVEANYFAARIGLTTITQETADYINEYPDIIHSDQFDINSVILSDNSDLGAGATTPPYQINSEDENLPSEESNIDSFPEVQDSRSDFGNYQSFSIATSSSRITSNLDNLLSTNLAMSSSHEDDSDDAEESSIGGDRVELNASERIVNDPRHSGVDDEGLPITQKGFGGRPLLEESNLRHSLYLTTTKKVMISDDTPLTWSDLKTFRAQCRASDFTSDLTTVVSKWLFD